MCVALWNCCYQITAFEAQPDPIHYLTRFLDGLKTAVRVLVAIQQPQDLDAAYTLALMYEELGDVSKPMNQQASVSGRRSHAGQVPPSSPPACWVSKLVEEKKSYESNRSVADEKWASLRAFRKSKGLCFTCGERWGREHQCKNSIQLHVMKEMIDCIHPVQFF
jgi:hypothetical protein